MLSGCSRNDIIRQRTVLSELQASFTNASLESRDSFMLSAALGSQRNKMNDKTMIVPKECSNNANGMKTLKEMLLAASINFTTLTHFGLSNAINFYKISRYLFPRLSLPRVLPSNVSPFKWKKLHCQWLLWRVKCLSNTNTAFTCT